MADYQGSVKLEFNVIWNYVKISYKSILKSSLVPQHVISWMSGVNQIVITFLDKFIDGSP